MVKLAFFLNLKCSCNNTIYLLVFKDQTRRHRTELMDRDNELEGTKEKMRSQEMDFMRTQEEETQ